MYIVFDIHEEDITRTAMNNDGIIEFMGNFPNAKERCSSARKMIGKCDCSAWLKVALKIRFNHPKPLMKYAKIMSWHLSTG